MSHTYSHSNHKQISWVEVESRLNGIQHLLSDALKEENLQHKNRLILMADTKLMELKSYESNLR